MKKIIGISLVLGIMALGTPALAQTKAEKAGHGVKKTARKAGHEIKKGAKAVGNETAEIATKTKGKVTDKKSKEWVAPNGKDIYVDDGNRYYWVNERGGREFLSKKQLKPKQ